MTDRHDHDDPRVPAYRLRAHLLALLAQVDDLAQTLPRLRTAITSAVTALDDRLDEIDPEVRRAD